MTPEPCLAPPCRSPVACGGWRYCRERNMAQGIEPPLTPAQGRLLARFGRLPEAYVSGSRLIAAGHLSLHGLVEHVRQAKRLTGHREPSHVYRITPAGRALLWRLRPDV